MRSRLVSRGNWEPSHIYIFYTSVSRDNNKSLCTRTYLRLHLGELKWSTRSRIGNIYDHACGISRLFQATTGNPYIFNGNFPQVSKRSLDMGNLLVTKVKIERKHLFELSMKRSERQTATFQQSMHTLLYRF